MFWTRKYQFEANTHVGSLPCIGLSTTTLSGGKVALSFSSSERTRVILWKMGLSDNDANVSKMSI